jgi:hypothetical protein
MTAHYLDFPCGDCGDKAGKPCVRTLYPHAARRRERDAARAKEGALAAGIAGDDCEFRPL